MKNRKFALPGVLLAISAIWLSACGGSDVTTDPTYSNKDRDNLYKNGSILSDKGGTDVFGPGSEKNTDAAGIGVNGFLWRASLDTISFMPIASADPFGGVIITDWYSSPNNPNERVRINIFIRDRDLRADGIKVSVFRQIRGANGNWADVPVAAATSGSLENTILTKARQIRLAQKDFK